MVLLAEVFTPAGGLPPLPDESVERYLDAAESCIVRFGWSRTSVKDVAAAVGVERTTVYRRVGSMDDILRLLVARELHRLVALLPTWVPEGEDLPEVAVELLASSIDWCRAHPMLVKVLADEPEAAASVLVEGSAGLVERIVELVEPRLADAMDLGLLGRRDPGVLADWIARIGLSLLIVPPPGDLRHYLREVLGPVLAPSPTVEET